MRGLVILARDGSAPSYWRRFAFFTGILLDYSALQTYADYLSQHMFWVHRLQHLVLHHIAPILLVASAPSHVLRVGLAPLPQAFVATNPAAVRGLSAVLRWIQNPWMALFLFVGLIYFWLIPSVHFGAMLDANRYLMMNWSMAVDGVLFWWLMLASRERQRRCAVDYGGSHPGAERRCIASGPLGCLHHDESHSPLRCVPNMWSRVVD
jgi:putative membrane protein